MSTTSRRAPGPSGTFGNRLAYERDRIGFIWRCHRDHGDVFRFSDAATVVGRPDLVHEVFVRTNNEFGTEAPLLATGARRYDTAQAMAGRQYGWRGMNPSAVRPYEPRFAEILRATLAATAGRDVDVLTVMKEFSGRSIVDFCLGPDNPDVVAAVADAANAAVALMAGSLSLPPWWPTPKVRRFRRTDAQVKAVLAARIGARRADARPAAPADLLDVLLAGDLDVTAVEQTIEVVLRASHGVPGAALAWVVWLFAREPELAEAAATEDDDHLEAFVKELLRMYPPTWLMGREVWEAATVGGYDVRPGEQVMFCAYLVHRDPRWWSEPDRFDVQRWRRDTAPHARHAYFPFGAGPRICLGNHLGIRQLIVAIRTLAREYDTTVTTPATPMSPQALLVPANLRARFALRP